MEKLRFVPSYTVEDYELWEGDWELWDGVPVSISPSPSRRHQRIAMSLATDFSNQLRDHGSCQCEVLFELDWRLDHETVLRPDLVVTCDRSNTKYLEKAPSLIAEITSTSTAGRDRVFKRQTYATHGVRHYLIVDPEARTVESLRLDGDTYVAAGPRFELHDGCTLTLDSDKLWA